MTNFRIGGLVAAAVAESLFILRRRPLFDHAARFCVWFGAVAGVAAGVLGWFFGGFRLVDSDWILLTHRWLGTAAVVVMVMVIVLWTSERARSRPERGRRLYQGVLFGGTALVMATGFFGGAMVYGIDHYLPW